MNRSPERERDGLNTHTQHNIHHTYLQHHKNCWLTEACSASYRTRSGREVRPRTVLDLWNVKGCRRIAALKEFQTVNLLLKVHLKCFGIVVVWNVKMLFLQWKLSCWESLVWKVTVCWIIVWVCWISWCSMRYKWLPTLRSNYRACIQKKPLEYVNIYFVLKEGGCTIHMCKHTEL